MLLEHYKKVAFNKGPVMSLSELRELVMDREAWRAVIHGVAELDTTVRLNCTLYNQPRMGLKMAGLRKLASS